MNPYLHLTKISDWFQYHWNSKLTKNIVVLTFDDEPSLLLSEYLHLKDIKATFFAPLKSKDIDLVAGMGHEIGNHGIEHTKSEVYELSLPSRCMRERKAVSWRFPFTSWDWKRLMAVKEAGYLLDSTQGSFYPYTKIENEDGLYEFPFLRLSEGQMDVNEKVYPTDYILDKVIRFKGIFVLPFHSYYQEEHFEEFKKLIERLEFQGVKFMTLRGVCALFKEKGWLDDND